MAESERKHSISESSLFSSSPTLTEPTYFQSYWVLELSPYRPKLGPAPPFINVDSLPFLRAKVSFALETSSFPDRNEARET